MALMSTHTNSVQAGRHRCQLQQAGKPDQNGAGALPSAGEKVAQLSEPLAARRSDVVEKKWGPVLNQPAFLWTDGADQQTVEPPGDETQTAGTIEEM